MLLYFCSEIFIVSIHEETATVAVRVIVLDQGEMLLRPLTILSRVGSWRRPVGHAGGDTLVRHMGTIRQCAECQVQCMIAVTV